MLTLGHRHWRAIGREPVPLQGGDTLHTVNETIDASVFDRWRSDAGYRPQSLADWAERHKVEPGDFTTAITADGAMTTLVD